MSSRPQSRARFENFRTEIFGGRSSEAYGPDICKIGERKGTSAARIGFLLAALHSGAKTFHRGPT
jgi:hypothetical protein